jgi:hypothetical protein
LVNVFSVLHSVTDSNYPSGAFKPLVNVRICNSRENRKYIYQKSENTKGVIRICNSRENRQYIYQKFEDTTGVIRICN